MHIKWNEHYFLFSVRVKSCFNKSARKIIISLQKDFMKKNGLWWLVFKKIIYIYNVLHNKHQTHVNETGSGSDNLSLVWRDRLQHWYQQHCARTVKYSWETMSERCNILYIYEVTATLTRRKPTQLSETDLCLFLLFFNIVWNGIYTRYILCLST